MGQGGVTAADAAAEPADDGHARWRTGEFRVLNDSVANLSLQMVLAIGGMYLAYLGASWLNDRWFAGDETGTAFLLRGLIFCLLGSAAIYVTSARPIRKALLAQRGALVTHEKALKEQTARHQLAGRLQSAFEMAESDHDGFGIVTTVLAAITDRPAELLLADSSRAHLRRVAVAAGNGGPGCGVETPWGCPAVRRSRTLSFEDSREIDACPRLRDRDQGACSAICVPVTILGVPMGVLHTTDDPGRVTPPEVRDGLEALAQQAGSRIGILRAMASSELQATTDPLTGLLNRRSLEAELSRLRDRGDEYAVAFLDLDHFKDLNDTYGHDTGDRALRCFAQIARRAVRDTDLVCRYGGEEFVVVFTGSDCDAVMPILDRMVHALADATSSGEIPPFTVSIGLADTHQVIDRTDVIRHADEAMFRAKQAGRDRIVVADSQGGGTAPAVLNPPSGTLPRV